MAHNHRREEISVDTVAYQIKKKKTEEKFNNKFSNITEENREKKPVNLFLFSYFPEWCVQEIYTAK